MLRSSRGARLHGGDGAVGVEINANHVRGAPVGSTVYAEGRPLKVGRTLQVGGWTCLLIASNLSSFHLKEVGKFAIKSRAQNMAPA